MAYQDHLSFHFLEVRLHQLLMSSHDIDSIHRYAPRNDGQVRPLILKTL